jgi:hypothetical protein
MRDPGVAPIGVVLHDDQPAVGLKDGPCPGHDGNRVAKEMEAVRCQDAVERADGQGLAEVTGCGSEADRGKSALHLRCQPAQGARVAILGDDLAIGPEQVRQRQGEEPISCPELEPARSGALDARPDQRDMVRMLHAVRLRPVHGGRARQATKADGRRPKAEIRWPTQKDGDSVSVRSLPHRLAILTVAAVVAGCDLALPVPRDLGSSPVADPLRADAGPRPSFAVAAELDPRSTCVLDPDPANGGHPAPPAEVAATGDPTKPTGVIAVRAVGLGDIVLPSDRLLVNDFFAMDSFFLPDMPAVELDGFTGRAPVCLHIAQLQPADERAAFLHVRFGDGRVDHWVLGTSGFGVDGGTGGIASAEAVRPVTASAALDVYFDTLEAHSVNTWGWANLVTDPASGANVIGFSTGYGDGGFPVYAGIGRDGQVVAVVIDLLVLPWRWLALVGPVPGTGASG